MPRHLLLIIVTVWLLGCQNDAHKTPLPSEPKAETKPASSFSMDPDSLKRLDATLPVRSCPVLAVEEASKLVSLSLTCAEKEYPNKPDLTLVGDESLLPPHEQWPAFFGCYDWHSSVHGHWSMARILKLFPAIPEAARLRALLDKHLSPKRIQKERAYFDLSHTKLFERPYGWAWLLRLQAELLTWDDPDARRWAVNLKPLADLLAARMVDYLNRLSVPVRAGTHGNTAYALTHMLDYARTAKDEALEKAITTAARRFYLGDMDCPTAYEPSGEDFISPCLVEADLLRRVLDRTDFEEWLDSFLPPLDSKHFLSVREPVEVRDPQDPRIGHLIGLSFQRAASFRGIAQAMHADDPRRPLLIRMADWQCSDGLARMTESGYGGEHWLASFVFYLRTGAGL
ncbi:MAG: DUF2891 domain-containing protein [Myxococcales bacterium]|nr:MAG: DUF2891 domain-containing protein [Myxococcales bacterium]